ncbi:MAG: sulfate ABC transporter substrate-binding protein [Synechococcales bacterium]|nr:sulfate ABC transporter substrate-binding protein [Synechococcales bacterium]
MTVLFVAGLVLASSLSACSQSPSGGTDRSSTATGQKPEVEITLVSFAVTKAAHEAIIPKFVAKWQQEKGQTVRFQQSYGGSGSQTRAVIDGLKADVVHLALGLDVSKIEQEGLIQPNWETEAPNNAIVSKSVVALVTREGNPKGIKDWSDLAKPGVSWVTADPKTSGVARWNFLALWNGAIKTGADEKKAQEFVTQAYKNVPILTRDAREATDVFFKQGQGDALINYENEVLLAEKQGTQVTYTIPSVNISIDNPIAVVDSVVDQKGTREVAEAFVQYLFSPEAQAEFAKAGFRPVNDAIANAADNTAKYPKVNSLSTVKDFGGWASIQKKFFSDGAVFDQIQAQK